MGENEVDGVLREIVMGTPDPDARRDVVGMACLAALEFHSPREVNDGCGIIPLMEMTRK